MLKLQYGQSMDRCNTNNCEYWTPVMYPVGDSLDGCTADAVRGDAGSCQTSVLLII